MFFGNIVQLIDFHTKKKDILDLSYNLISYLIL